MIIENENGIQEELKFLHICTDGTNNGIIHIDNEDYEQARKITAICAYRHKIKIIADCHMTTHSHWAVQCESMIDAQKFVEAIKHNYGQYFFKRHGISSIYRNVSATIVEIYDLFQLRRCISYILLNPVAAKIVSSPELYHWSSFQAYFQTGHENQTARKLTELSMRELRTIFKTHDINRDAGFQLDENNRIIPRSYIDWKLVESIFRNQTQLFRSLSITNYAVEENLYLGNLVKYNDNDLLVIARALAKEKFGQEYLHNLTMEQKIRLIMPLKHKCKVSHIRIARVLGLKRDYVKQLIGENIG